MLKQPIYTEFNLDAKVGVSKLIAVTHTDDRNADVLEVSVRQNGVHIDLTGATAIARMVLHKDRDYLLSDSVPCAVSDGGNILIPFDSAVVPVQKGVIKIEVNLTQADSVLTLQFPIWVSVNGSILDSAEITPESKGTVPELLKEAAEQLERVKGFATEAFVFESLDTALQGNPNVSPSLFVMQDAQTGNYKLVYMDSDDNLHVLFDFGLLHVPTKTSELTNDSGYIFPVCVGSIDACTQPRTLYYTVFENRHAYVFNTDTADSWMDGKKVYTDIIRVQYVFVDGKIRTRDKMYHDDTASWSEWSTWKVTGTDNYNKLTNRPRINGHTLSGNQTSEALGLQKKLTAGNNVEIDADGVISAKTVFAVNLTLTSWIGGVMDKTAGQIAEAYNQGKTVIFKGMFDGQELSLKAIAMAVGTEDETITISAIAITEPDGTLYHVYIPHGETDSFSLRTYNLRGIASASVNQNGTISFYDADGNLLFTTSGANLMTSGNQQISMGYDSGGFYFLFDDEQEAV